jgi:flagellin
MVVQHNLTAMNSNRMLGITTSTQAKSTEKLSSGYKINRAADDAAGLSISEKMRKQIRGLTQASANANDGISAVQTAEGALSEVQDMLQRMNELAVKAANGTNSEDDRSYIQNEIDQLTTEIDRVAETTKFNETYLLKGDRNATKGFSLSYKVAAAASQMGITWNGADANGFTLSNGSAGSNATSDAVNEVLRSIRDQGLSVSFNSHWNADKATPAAENSYSISLNGSAAEKYRVVAHSGDTTGKVFDIQTNDGVSVVEGITITATGLAATAATKDNLNVNVTSQISAKSVTAQVKDTDIAQYYDKDGNAISANALQSYFTVTPPASGSDPVITANSGVRSVYDAVGNERTLKTGEVSAKQDITGDLTLKLHVGADATTNNQISVSLSAMTSKGLGVNGLDVSGANDSKALKSIETIKEAIQKVSTQRSALGAVQNRLEHTIKNLDNVVENTTAAESQIRDTDMASEMVKYSNNNILSQAGQSMLAQANQTNQGVLSLLG